MKQQHLKIRRERRCNCFDPKKIFIISCSLGLVFYSLTFMYTFRNLLRNAPFMPQPETTTTTTIPKRININVISFPRSGSTFLGEIFHHHPGVFYLFEPIGPVQILFSRVSILEFDFLSPTYQHLVLKVFEDINNCQFSRDLFTPFVGWQNGRHRRTRGSPLCFRNGTSAVCQNLNTRQFEYICKNNYTVLAAKILTPRLLNSPGEWTKNLFESCSSNGKHECKIIHLVRDPRAVVDSLKALTFFKTSLDPRRELSWYVEKVCHQMESDIKIGKLMKEFSPDGYKLIRFEDLARNPLGVVNELYKFTGIEMLDSVEKWLQETTRINHGNAFSTSRNSQQVVSNWRTKMSPASVQIVEKYCGRLMGELNYKLTGMSPKKQLDLNISLID